LSSADLRPRAPALFVLLLLLAGCRSLDSKAWNLGQLHDDASRHRYHGALESDFEYVLRHDVAGVFRGAGARLADKDASGIDDPAQRCLENLVDLAAYRARLIERFANPALAHRTRQIAMDGSQKIPQRWLATVRDRLARDESIERLALAVAAWLHFLRGIDEAGQRYPIDDPLAADLAALGSDAHTLCGFAPVFGDLGHEPRFVAPVARQLAALRTRGVQATLEALP